eukprot:TRINITY_DN9715_c0_g1_i4.p2 TRINITY_DN9715_c0_g1~~TRINITY_DN9715_c0_g1_i4.p2  ORF type:complete len:229 (-),score=78.58 TRINITY_DN9715_c0_g1_i4:131-817(-)
MVGNHCLYNMPRAQLNKAFNIHSPEADCSYYSFVHQGFRFIILDGYDISAEGWAVGHPKSAVALTLLATVNPNRNQNSPEGLDGLQRRFVRFNGGVGPQQLRWLRQELQEAGRQKQRVVVCSHQPLHPESAAPVCLLWNYASVLSLLWERPRGEVVAVFAGHAHRGGYVRDEQGIHHQVVEACLETPPGQDAHALVYAYEDRLVVEGRGAVRSLVMPFETVEGGGASC